MTETPIRTVDLENGLADAFADLGWTVTRTGTDLQERIAQSGAVVRFRRTGGVDQGWQVIARVSTEVYAATYDKAWNVAEELARRLTLTPLIVPGQLVDRVVSESANAEMPYSDQNIRLVVAAWRITVRR